MEMTLSFWGSQGRVGLMTAGEMKGSLLFAYPDTFPEWWTLVVDPSPYDDVPGDDYTCGYDLVQSLFKEWGVVWLERSPEEEALERERFGWRPLRGPVDWLAP